MLTCLKCNRQVIWMWNVPIELAINKDISYFILSLRTSQYTIHPVWYYIHRNQSIFMRMSILYGGDHFSHFPARDYFPFMRHTSSGIHVPCVKTYIFHIWCICAYISLVLPSFARMFCRSFERFRGHIYISVTCFIYTHDNSIRPLACLYGYMYVCMCRGWPQVYVARSNAIATVRLRLALILNSKEIAYM